MVDVDGFVELCDGGCKSLMMVVMVMREDVGRIGRGDGARSWGVGGGDGEAVGGAGERGGGLVGGVVLWWMGRRRRIVDGDGRT